MKVYSNANHQPTNKHQPICWAFFVISDHLEPLEELSKAMTGYELVRWIQPGKWALVHEIFYHDGEGLSAVKEELAFFKSVGEVIQWEKQGTPGLEYLEQLGTEVENNFYADPNDAMRHWMEASDVTRVTSDGRQEEEGSEA